MGYHFYYSAWDDYKNAEKRDAEKIDKLLKVISRGNYESIGHAEKLRHEKDGICSVHINKKDRLVFRIKEDMVEIIQCKGHYGDH